MLKSSHAGIMLPLVWSGGDAHHIVDRICVCSLLKSAHHQRRQVAIPGGLASFQYGPAITA